MLKQSQHLARSDCCEIPDPSTTAAAAANSNFSSPAAAEAQNFNGVNNNNSNRRRNDDGGENSASADNEEEEDVQLSSSVVIEIAGENNDDENDEKETATTTNATEDEEEEYDDFEEEEDEQQHETDMISSPAPSTISSSSTTTADHPPPPAIAAPPPIMIMDPPLPIIDDNAAADQQNQEVADFLDMDFDVEPTSTDDDEEEDSNTTRSKAATTISSMNTDRRNHRGGQIDCTTATIIDYHQNTPSTSSTTGDHADHDLPSSSTTIKYESSISTPIDIHRCVHGCRSCSGDQNRPSSSSITTAVIGDIPPINSNRLLYRPPASSGYHQQHRIANIGGPDGLDLSRSAYASPPPASRPGIGFSNGIECAAAASTDIGKYCIWTVEQAARIQTVQIGPSACGATALVNVFRALAGGGGGGGGDSTRTQLSIEEIDRAVPTRLRAYDAPVAEYLRSRSMAGTDAEDLIEAATALTGSRVSGRFFHMDEQMLATSAREAGFGRWLMRWLRRGAVPVLTLNMQRGVLGGTEPMPDAWHHQMVWGVCTRTGGVYVTNPLDCLPMWFVRHALCSPSVLLVRAGDVRDRWNGRSADLGALITPSSWSDSGDSRTAPPTSWVDRNVLGQVAQVLRETCQQRSGAGTCSSSEPTLSHVSIPARYRSGVTLFALTGTRAWRAVVAHPSNLDYVLSLSLSTPYASTNDPMMDDWEGVPPEEVEPPPRHSPTTARTTTAIFGQQSRSSSSTSTTINGGMQNTPGGEGDFMNSISSSSSGNSREQEHSQSCIIM